MRGNINWQIQQIYHKSGIKKIGLSKNNAKNEIRKTLSQINRGATWHAMGKKIGIFSHATADSYRAVWKQLGRFAKENYKIKDMEKIEGVHIQVFLKYKISENIKYSTFAQYAAACEKLESALNGFAKNQGTGKTYQFTNSIKETRVEAQNKLFRFKESRAYTNPKKMIKTLSGENKIVAQIQLESGARIKEANHLSEKNLFGIEKDPLTGEEKGKLKIEKAKGGITGYKYISKETYKQLYDKIQSSESKLFKFDMWKYRTALKKAAEISNQDYNGSHGLRWNFAQERFYEVQVKGDFAYEQALVQVSKEMFHNRGDITEHYLK